MSEDNFIKIKILDSKIAERFLKLINKKCKFCGMPLEDIIYYYNHDSGVFIKELGKKAWLYIECSNENCKYQWSFYKLLFLKNKQEFIGKKILEEIEK